MHKIFIYTVTFLLTASISFAQNPKTIDSLQKVLKKKISDKEKVDTYNLLAGEHRNTDSLSTSQYTSRAIKLAKKINYKEAIVEAHIHLAWLNLRKGNYPIAQGMLEEALGKAKKISDQKGKARAYVGLGVLQEYKGEFASALEYLRKALKIFKKINAETEIANTYNSIGIIYYRQGKDDKAVSYFLKASKIYESIKYNEALASNYSNIANIYTRQGNYPVALEHQLKALKIAEILKDERRLGINYNGLANIYYEQENFAEALKYNLKALKIKEKLKDKRGIAITSNSIGEDYLRLKKYNLAIKYLVKALKIDKEIGDKIGVAYDYYALGIVYIDIKKYAEAQSYLEKALDLGTELQDKALISSSASKLGRVYYDLKEYDKAIDFARKGITLAKENGYNGHAKEASEVLAESYQKKGDYQKAYENYVLFKELSDSLYNEENTKKIAHLEAQYKYDKKEQQLKLKQAKKEYKLKQQIQQQTYLLYGIALALFFLVVVAVIYYRYSKRLKELNATKDKLFAIVAHDLKNPLSAFRSITQSLSENLGAISKEEINYFLGKINKSSGQLYNLLQNLLQWAISQTGQLEYKPQNLDLRQASSEVKAQLQSNAEIKDIALENNIADDAKVFADSKMTNLVIRNLVSNAIKFTPQGGEVKIEAESNGKQVQVRVQDTGIGISKADQAKLFKVEEDNSKIGSSKEKGTGLGLILCKELVEKQGGKIWVESQEGKGSSFIFTLPKSS